MYYLSFKQILLIHSVIVNETGGVHGLRDLNIILGCAQTPRQKVFGTELYPTIFDKASVYAKHIIMYHPFLDGNKRTGITVAMVFLEYNNYQIIARQGEIEKMALRIVNRKLEIKEIADWLKNNSKKLKRKAPDLNRGLVAI